MFTLGRLLPVQHLSPWLSVALQKSLFMAAATSNIYALIYVTACFPRQTTHAYCLAKRMVGRADE